ncbi:hypothetical protein Tco_1397441 [Tanacetum coccineum]
MNWNSIEESFWIQVHDLPLGMLSSGYTTELAKSLGKLIELDCVGEGPQTGRDFLRFRVEINTTKQLVSSNQHMFQTTHSNATQPTKTEDLHEDLEYEKRNSTSINTSKNAASRSMAPCLPPIVVSERKRRGRPKKNIVSGNLLSNILMSPDLIDVPVQMLESDTSKNSPKVVVADLKQPHDKC